MFSAKVISAILTVGAVRAAPTADSDPEPQIMGIPGMSHPMPTGNPFIGGNPMGTGLPMAGSHPMAGGNSPHPANQFMTGMNYPMPAHHLAGALPVHHAYPVQGAADLAGAFRNMPSNCKIEQEVIVTHSCKPTIENVCSKQMVDTEEIEYEKICKDITETICNGGMPAYASHFMKRDAEADAEAESNAQFFGNEFGSQPSSAITKVKSTCHEVTTHHCFNNPNVKIVPVEVEHCHPVTKANCSDVENPIPKTVCEPVETTIAAAQPGFPSVPTTAAGK